MSNALASMSVRVDITNPGQFFACCGLLEVAHRLWPQGQVEGWFDDGQFWLARHDEKPACVRELVKALSECDAQRVPVDDQKIDPIQLGDPIGIRLDWWRTSDGETNPFKTWAANATSLQMFIKWQDPLGKVLGSLDRQGNNILYVSHAVQGSYGFDSDLGWDALTVGFSLNEHNHLRRLPTRPAVELFGAVGLQRFFPRTRSKEEVRYSVWRVPLTAPVACAAALGLVPSVTLKTLRTCFVFRGCFKGLKTATIAQGEINE